MKRLTLILLSLGLFFILTVGSTQAQHFTPMAITGSQYSVTITTAQLNSMIVMGLLLLVAGTLVMRRRQLALSV